MNEALPDWRTFSSRVGPQPGKPGGPAGPGAPRGPVLPGAPGMPGVPGAPQPTPGRVGPTWLVAGLLAGGTGALAAAGVMLVALAAGAGSGTGGLGSVGEPLSLVPSGDSTPGGQTVEPVSPGEVGTIVVDVAGGVVRPGLQRLGVEDRVGDAIAAAGGFAPRADLAETARAINLAEPLTDGMKVLVPELGTTDPETGGGGGADGRSGDGRIDLNLADQAALETLPGIGPVTALRIMDARAERAFASVDDLRSREVVGQAVFEQIQDLVRVGR